jgi:hypothetical protein
VRGENNTTDNNERNGDNILSALPLPVSGLSIILRSTNNMVYMKKVYLNEEVIYIYTRVYNVNVNLLWFKGI